MRTKAIKDLAQLSGEDFFQEVSAGLGHILSNSTRLFNDACKLYEQERSQSASILNAFAEEEASKFVILIDAVRCPRVQKDIFTRQLRRFNDHLSKGIYVKNCKWRPKTFGNLIEYIEDECKEYYLDGPNNIDWIFRNEILQGREETIYVDYAETDEGHEWIFPRDYPAIFKAPDLFEPNVLSISSALKDIGCIEPEALRIIADIWHPIKMTEDFHWQDVRKINIQVLETLKDKKLLIEQPEQIYSKVVDGWPFPLYSIDFKLEKVSRDKLKEIQDKWTPDL